jgi:hypothetical protein
MPKHSENRKTCYLCRFNGYFQITASNPLGLFRPQGSALSHDKRNCFADIHDPEA